MRGFSFAGHQYFDLYYQTDLGAKLWTGDSADFPLYLGDEVWLDCTEASLRIQVKLPTNKMGRQIAKIAILRATTSMGQPGCNPTKP